MIRSIWRVKYKSYPVIIDPFSSLRTSIEERAIGGITRSDQAPRRVAIPITSSIKMVDPRYEGWNQREAIRAKKRRFVSYDTFMDLIVNWREVRVGIIEHSATILSQVSRLGEANFYGRNKRFGRVDTNGDVFYVDLSEARIRKILDNIIIALQTTSGEGRAKRLGKEASTTAGAEDSALNVAHQLAELAELMTSDQFIEDACFTREKFEHEVGLRWVE